MDFHGKTLPSQINQYSLDMRPGTTKNTCDHWFYERITNRDESFPREIIFPGLSLTVELKFAAAAAVVAAGTGTLD